jgi:soluble lytic murein transglycosylase
MRSPVAPVAGILLLALLTPSPLACAGPDAVFAGTSARVDSSAVLDSARAEMAVGRHWHAAVLLGPLHEQGKLEPPAILLYARAHAGYRNWEGVRSILENQPWLDEAAVEAWGLLGRAREEGGLQKAAAEAYARALTDDGSSLALRVRRVRALWHAGARSEADGALAELPAGVPRSWLALELLEPEIGRGDTATVALLLARADVPAIRERAWDALARARLLAGDTAGAAGEYRAALATGRLDDAGRASAWQILGEASLAAGDSVAARTAFQTSLAASPRGTSAGASAERVVDLGELDAELALLAGRALDRAGDGRRALRAYDLHVALSEARGDEPDASARVERARLMATVSERQEEAIGEYRLLSRHADPRVGTRAMELWAGLRRRQGRTNDEATIRRWLVERYPNTSAAAGELFARADEAHDRGDLERALEAYGRVVSTAPEVDLGGLSRMRMGQILLQQDRLREAAETWEGYLGAFPSGRRWEEATYWAARARLALGDTAAGTALLERLQAEEPFSYYSVLTADLLDHPFAAEELPEGPGAAPPAWLDGDLDDLRVLADAGLTHGAAHHVEWLSARARDEGAPALYALAESLNALGHTLPGINLGWEIRRSGEPWNLRLLRIIYPFPHREMVLREAREWGVDPFLLAALIRQESAWVSDIVSHAGAVGLMQVMPSTGRGLARTVGPLDFKVESLETPEVNLHLGARFLVDVLERYGPDLPLVLSAYNAGPTRATRWRRFPEAVDPLRLTERIPFAETRGYVKNVTRNARLYEVLYGADTRVAR